MFKFTVLKGDVLCDLFQNYLTMEHKLRTTTCRNGWIPYPSGDSFFYFFLFYLFLAAMGLRCCARAFSSCGERGLLFDAVHGLLTVVASLVAEHRL